MIPAHTDTVKYSSNYKLKKVDRQLENWYPLQALYAKGSMHEDLSGAKRRWEILDMDM